jgi:hypothetical protein
LHFAENDTVPVWERWMSENEPRVIGKNPVFVIKKNCSECASSRSVTLEAGVRYVAATPQINVGVTSDEAGSILDICLEFVRIGESFWGNCSNADLAMWFSFEQRRTGQWVQIR